MHWDQSTMWNQPTPLMGFSIALFWLFFAASLILLVRYFLLHATERRRDRDDRAQAAAPRSST